MMQVARTAIKAPIAATGAATSFFNGATDGEQTLFVIYHSIDGAMGIELDLPLDLFEKQMAFLADNYQVQSYDTALQRLRDSAATAAVASAPAVVLTFDDGYSDFYTTVYPLLVEYGIPATLFVTTGFIEDGTPYPMMSHPELSPLPVSWDMLGKMHESGLVTIGAHTHTHPVLTVLTSDEIEEELAYPLELFEQRLGFRPVHFAYPKAIADPAVSAIVRNYYQSAAGAGGRFAISAGFDRYAIPRVPIRRSDGWTFFRAKLKGWMTGEERVYDALRALNKRRRG